MIKFKLVEGYFKFYQGGNELKNKLKKLILTFITVSMTVIISNIGHADPYDWQGKHMVNVPHGIGCSCVLGGIGNENAVDFSMHNMTGYGCGNYPDVVRLHQYDESTPLAFNCYMKIPLTDHMRISASQYFGIDADELRGQDLFVVINNPVVRTTQLLLRPQWAFASSVPGGRDIHIDTGAHVEVDARLFGSRDGEVSAPIRYDRSQYVNFHDMIKDGHWALGVSPDTLGVGSSIDGQSRAVLSYVNFVDGPIVGQKRLTLNLAFYDTAWNSFIDQVDRNDAIGNILLKMHRENCISVEVMDYLFGFEKDMLNAYKPGVRSLAIVPAPSRLVQPVIEVPTVAIPDIPTHDDTQTIVPHLPVQDLASGPVSVSTLATPSFRTPSKNLAKPLPVVTPHFEMSSGIPSDGELLTVYRVYNPNDGFHHYTMNRAEVDHLVSIGWRDEGEAFKCNNQGVPVYRVYNRAKGIHHFTTNSNERDDLVNHHGWEDEGIAWYALMQGEVPVFRIYNPGNGEHVWTTNYAEVEAAVAKGWNYEGIAWYMR
jgi:hypothetical protein